MFGNGLCNGFRKFGDYRLPITDYRLPILDYQLPISNYQLAITMTNLTNSSKLSTEAQPTDSVQPPAVKSSTEAQPTDSVQPPAAKSSREPQPTDSVQSPAPKSSIEPQPTDSAQPPAPKSSSHRWLWLLLGTIAIAGTGAGIWYGFFRPKNNNLIPFSGRIEGYETDVSTKGSGRVKEVTVREGATVTKGQLLVRLDDDEVQSELLATKSNVNAAKQREAAARLQISVLKSQVADTKLNLKQSEGDTIGKVAEAEAMVSTAQAAIKQEQARVAEARALLKQTKVDRDRFVNLANLGAETRQRADLAQTAFETAQAMLESRQAGVEVARNAIAIAEGKLTQAQTTALNPDRQATNISRLQTQINQAKVALLGAQADVKTAQANQQLIQSRLNNLTVKSPIAGIVTTRSVEPGTVVLPSRPLLRIVDMKQVYMRGFIPGEQIARIRVGQPTKVYLDSDPKHEHPLNAKVISIDAKASFTPENIYFQKDRVEQVFGVKLSFDKPGGFVKPGMPVDAEILLQK
ncbi:HlyD family efflux transporter periplasmic adaptor subunit [Microcoleus sp.]|uniref:HlyD family secretion protein n=1 Tax=Microcoleus sp. TaxID=44472 RepID=UPI003523B63A